MGLFYFHTPKNNKFDYKPRYYDPRKERLEQIKEKYENPERKLIEERIRGQFKRRASKRKVVSATLMRFLLILGILIALTYVVFKMFGMI